jgi:hypothetical protein
MTIILEKLSAEQRKFIKDASLTKRFIYEIEREFRDEYPGYSFLILLFVEY